AGGCFGPRGRCAGLSHHLHRGHRIGPAPGSRRGGPRWRHPGCRVTLHSRGCPRGGIERTAGRMSALINYFNDRDRDWRLDVFVIVALAVCLWVIPSGFREITDRSEALYLHVAHNIAHHDNWLVMYVHDQPYGEKPPLPFIIYALMMELSGGEIHAPLVRFPVHVATVAILL